MKIVCIFLLIIMFAYLSNISTSQAATLTSPTCSAIDVQKTVNKAKSGDTVLVPSGNCTWNTQVDIGSKAIRLQGVGMNEASPTKIEITKNFMLQFLDPGAGLQSYLTGFYFVNNLADWNGGIKIVSAIGSVRVHHNRFYTGPNAVARMLELSGHILLDNNLFDGVKSNQYFFIHNLRENIAAFKKPVGWGQNFSNNVDWVFVENNIFQQTCNSPSARNDEIFDIWGAGKLVFRYNTVINGSFNNHSTCWSGAGNPGVYAIEMYANDFIVQNGCVTKYMGTLMGGTMLLHNNNIKLYGTGYADGNYWNQGKTTWNMILWLDSRTRDTTHNCPGNLWQLCDGSENMFCSGSTSTTWYTCNAANNSCMSGGTNYGTCTLKRCSNSWTLCSNDSQCAGGTCSKYFDDLTTDPSNKTGYRCFNGTGAGQLLYDGTIDLDPVYLWNNSIYKCNTDGSSCKYYKRVGLTNDISVNTKLGRDIIDNGTTPKPGYSPFNYPHPLSAPLPPRNLRIQ